MKKKLGRNTWISIEGVRKLLLIARLTIFLVMLGILHLGAGDFQQTFVVNGKVTNTDGEPIPGVTVIVKGTTTGAVTGIDGDYEINAPDRNSTIVFSFIGMTTQEVPIEGRSSIDITMEETMEALEEVIVVGYGTQKRMNLTGSVATVNLDKVDTRPVTQISQILAGTTTGVTVMQSDAQPGSDGATIYVRGLNTLNSTSPLVVIDGVIGSMGDVAPTDVAAVTILKDAASSAIYGARAANGVILITTKRGKTGKIGVKYDFYYGIQEATRLAKTVSNSATFMEMMNSSHINAGSVALYSDEIIEEYRTGTDPYLHANTDWLDYIMGDTGEMQSHNFTIQGGTDQSRFRISLGYFDQAGVMQKTNTEYYTFRANFDSKVSDKFNFGMNLYGRWRNTGSPGSTSGIISSGDNASLSSNPMVVPVAPDGRYGGIGTPFDISTRNAQKNFDTLVRDVESHDFTTKIFANYELMKGLTLSGNAAIDFNNTKQLDYETTWEQWNFRTNEIDQASTIMWLQDYNSRNYKITLYSTLDYKITLNENHNFHALAGYQQESYRMDDLEGYVSQFANNNLFVLDAGLDIESQTSGGNATEWALQSLFGRFDYNYKGKYLLEANLRYDGSSRFSPDGRWGVFPSFSAGWRLSDEKFMQPLSFLNNLKLRASWGKIGNNSIGNYAYLATYAFNNNYVLDGSVNPGVAITAMTNEDIKWETTVVTDFGFDATIFNNLLEISGDYFIRNPQDILLTVPIPKLVGNLSSPVRNLGEVQNKGWELSFTHRNNIKDFNYSARLNLSHVVNEVLKYGDAPNLSKNMLKEGLPAWSLFGYEVVGIFQTQEEVDAAPYQNVKTGAGDLQYVDQITVDVDGDGIPDETDGKIDGDDRVVLGNPFPDLVYGLNLNLGWKGFDLFALIQGREGSKGWLQGALSYHNSFGGFRGIYTEKWLDAWTPENTNTNVPRMNANGLSEGNNEYWVQDQSYMRMKSLQLGYTIPSTICNKIGADLIRVYANADNLFTITDFEGFDPERGLTASGVSYPLHKTYTFGINVSF